MGKQGVRRSESGRCVESLSSSRWRLWLEMGTSEAAVAELTLPYPRETVGGYGCPEGSWRR